MSSPGQKRGNCGHAMALFDGHSCACCREKGKGQDPCAELQDTECKFCIVLTPGQKAQLATPSYKLKKEKREAKKMDSTSTPSKDGTLVEQATVSVIGAVSDTGSVSSPLLQFLRRKQGRTSHLPLSPRNLQKASRQQTRKWKNLIRSGRDRFNRLEVLLTDLLICCQGITISFSSS